MTNRACFHEALYRYDAPDVRGLILAGSIRVSTLAACRTAENPQAADDGKGTKTTTSMPGVDYPDAVSFAQLLGVDSKGIHFEGDAPVVVCGDSAFVRKGSVDAFVFCMSALGDADVLRDRFGPACTRIVDPIAFVEVVDSGLRTAVPGGLGQCMLGQVVYAGREDKYRDHSSARPAFLKPARLPRHFEIEEEVRAVGCRLASRRLP